MSRRLISLLVLALLTGPVAAHAPSDSYLRLAVEGATVEGRWDVALRDLDYALRLDADGDGAITWGEVRQRETEITALLRSRLAVEADTQRCTLDVAPLAVVQLNDGPYLSLPLQGQCATVPQRLTLRYGLFFELDPQHRGLLQLRLGDQTRLGVFAPDRRSLDFEAGVLSPGRAFRQYFREGLFHIAIGLDHLLFLAGLLLPAVVWRQAGGWVAAPRARDALVDVLRIITAFTAAHALALTLASLGVLTLPTRLTEAAVAATIVFAAINNLWPMVRRRLWVVAFGFGLIHGAGYASVLTDLGVSSTTLALALLGFNLGVEGMQVAAAAVFVPLAFLLRHRPFYQWGVVALGSAVVAALGGVWFVERAFNLRFTFF
ncbi:HupE/UreJ family protein [Flagellatimonas centrodinii]|uniref:HupE/UreJ family protein n=1 Tax=Flagellatimonas centrodinii TaxID=2806210 RepID=UPI001FEF7C20|nr:HupE/UreJ family protein [Flagellatimonas centrodinii]ULQ45558.1 HupE/UreJ family protein [Flagellatimonas centrodinii]